MALSIIMYTTIYTQSFPKFLEPYAIYGIIYTNNQYY